MAHRAGACRPLLRRGNRILRSEMPGSAREAFPRGFFLPQRADLAHHADDRMGKLLPACSGCFFIVRHMGFLAGIRRTAAVRICWGGLGRFPKNWEAHEPCSVAKAVGRVGAVARPLDNVKRTFTQVDVFTAEPLRGNPLAIVHDAKGLSEAQMAALARWTNLSETTFLLPPTDANADYYVRIFTPSAERSEE